MYAIAQIGQAILGTGKSVEKAVKDAQHYGFLCNKDEDGETKEIIEKIRKGPRVDGGLTILYGKNKKDLERQLKNL